MTRPTAYDARRSEIVELPRRVQIGAMDQIAARHVRRAVSQMAAVAMQAFPHGGQSSARRNAHEAMMVDQLRARARSEAVAALDAANGDPRRLVNR